MLNENREHKIIKTSLISLLANIILSAFKISMGLFSASTVIVLDGVENISNALGIILTIIGIKLSSKTPDKKHPLGYGRIEYITDLLVSTLVIYIGFTALIASVGNIKNATNIQYDGYIYFVLVISAIVKLLLSKHEKDIGFKLKSRALVAAAVDSFANALISISIILSALIRLTFGINLEHFIGIVIALLIIRGGIIMIRDTMDEILGRRTNEELKTKIKNIILEFEEVFGVYDLVLHSYGREKNIGSVHIEIKSSLSTLELDLLERKIAKRIYDELHVVLAGISIYTINVDDKSAHSIHKFIKSLESLKESILNIHGILIDTGNKKVYFDIVVNFNEQNIDGLIREIKRKIKTKYPEYEVHIQNDVDI